MPILYINTGTNPNAGDGDSIRLAFTKINSNFGEVTDQLSSITAPSALVSGTYTFALSTTGTVTLNGDPFVSGGGGSSDRLISPDTTKTLVLDDNSALTLRGFGTYTAFVSEIASGSEGAPTAVTSGTVIAALNAGGYDGNQWISDRNNSVAWLEFKAVEGWNGNNLTATNVGTTVSLNVHPPEIQLSTNTHQTILSTSWGSLTRNAPPSLTINFGNADEDTPLLVKSDGSVTYKGIGGTYIHYHHVRPILFGVTSSRMYFTGNISGNVLTISEILQGQQFKISLGSTLASVGVDCYVTTGTQIVSYGTGIGGTGTYIVNISQTVPNSTMLSVAANNFGMNGTNQLIIDTSRRSGIRGNRLALKQNDDIGGLFIRGQATDNSFDQGNEVGSLYWEAREDFTDTEVGSRAYLTTTNIGDVNSSARLLLDNQQNQYRSALHVFNGAGNYRSTATITSAGPNSGLEPGLALDLDETNNQPCDLILNTNNGEGPGGEIVLHTGADQGISLRANTNQDVVTITTASVVFYSTTASFNDINVQGLFTLGEFQGYNDFSIIKNDPDILNFTLRNIHVDSASEINLVDNISGGLTIVHQNSTAPSGDFAAGENFIYGESVNDTINIGRNQDLKFFANANWTNWSSATPVLVMRKSDGQLIVNNNINSTNIIPQSSSTYDLGASTSTWNNIWVNNINGTAVSDITAPTANGTFSTLPDFLEFFRGTTLRAGQTSEGVFFSGNAGGISYPVRTNFPINGTTKVIVTLDMVVNAGCSDFGLCILDGSEGGSVQPQWRWGSNPTRIAASYNCNTPYIYTLDDQIESGYNLPDDGTYRVRFTYDPNNSPNLTLETLGTSNIVLDTISIDGTLDTSKPYLIGFAADQDDTALRTYIKNLIIAVDGGDTYTDSLMLSGASNEITSTNTYYSVSVGDDGVVRMVTSRGGIEFGALPEVGGPNHLHIMRPAGQNGSTDLFFGDDYNYVKMPGLYGSDPDYQQGVEIGSSLNEGTVHTWKFGTDGTLTLPTGGIIVDPTTQNALNLNRAGAVHLRTFGPNDIQLSTDWDGTGGTWTFGTDGDLVLPAGKTIRDTDGNDLLSTGGGLLPPYKGFRAHYGSMYNETSGNVGPINKLVIYKDTVSPASAIDTSTSSDDFQVTGLTGSDVVAMLVVVSTNVTQTPTADLKTFVEAVIDNVILNGGVEGDIRNVSDIRTAFYDNFSNFNSIIGSVKTNLEFFNTDNLNYNIIDTNAIINSGTGSGWYWYSIRYNTNTSQLEMGSGSTGAPGGFQVGDTLTILGTNLQDYQSNTLTSPDNDLTITVDSIDGIGIPQSYTITGTVPYTTPSWPSYSISDGGDDEYDGGNAIHTDLETNINYNSGAPIINATAFGGGDYVVTYQAGIFGIFATDANIDIIGTSGDNGGYGNDSSSSGFDGDGIAVTGGLYGDSTPTESPVIATWTNPNSNVWRIEAYNGGTAVSYNGGDYDAKWFDLADSPSGNNNFRGAIIEYHAFIEGSGTIIGTIHLSNDVTQEEATHTEHMSGNSNIQFMSLWDCNYERGQLYFKRTDGSNANLLIQWTAKIFYGSENYC